MPARPSSPSLNFPTASKALADAHHYGAAGSSVAFGRHPAPTTAITNGWRLVSFDRDFERFEGLDRLALR